jgi:uncharacterized delta-60 repeat protein
MSLFAVTLRIPNTVAKEGRVMQIRRSARFAALVLMALVPLAIQAAGYAIDTTFAGTGWQRSYVAGGGTVDERIVAAARAPDGGYVLAGSRPGGAAGALIFLAKFSPNGSYDSSFGGTAATGNAGPGRVLKDANLSSVKDMTVDTQGRVVVIGATPGALGQSDFGVARFKLDGTDDTGFAGDGGTVVAFDKDAANNRVNDVPGSVTTLPDGSVFVAGSIESKINGITPNVGVGLVKLNPDGSRATFGNGGDGTADYCNAFCDGVSDVARIVYDAPHNNLVIGGTYYEGVNNTDWFIVVRNLVSNSSQTRTYPIDLGGASGQQLAGMRNLTVQADGKSVAVGWAQNPQLNTIPVVMRINDTDRGEDPTFGNTAGRGLLVESDLVGGLYDGIAIDSLGRIVLAGDYAPARTGVVTRLSPAGAIEYGDGFPGVYYAKTSGPNTSYRLRFRSVLLDADRPVLAGESPDSTTSDTDYDLMITRLRSDLIFANGFQ